MLQQSLPKTYKEWLGEQSMLISELAAKDSLIEEQRKEIEVNIYSFTYVHMYIHMYVVICFLCIHM